MSIINNKGSLLLQSKSKTKKKYRIFKSLLIILIIVSIIGVFILSNYIYNDLNNFEIINLEIIISFLIIIVFLFLILISINRIFETDTITVFQNGILLPSKKFMFIQRNEDGKMIAEVKFHLFGGSKQFIYYYQIIKISYQTDMDSKEIIITPSNINKKIKSQLPKRLMFICIYTNENRHYILYQISIKGLNLVKIVSIICEHLKKDNKN